jgi:hypothetical protein
MNKPNRDRRTRTRDTGNDGARLRDANQHRVEPGQRVFRPLARANALGDEHRDCADGERPDRDHRRAQMFFDVVVEQQADDDDRDRAHSDPPQQTARQIVPAGQRRRDRANQRANLGAEVDQDRRERADVQGDVEGEPEVGRHFPAEEGARENQVRGARDWQELRQALQNPE